MDVLYPLEMFFFIKLEVVNKMAY